MQISEYEKINEAVDFIESRCSLLPSIGIVLGSGLGEFAGILENKTCIAYTEIPYFKKTGIKGHAGQLVLGKVGEKAVVAMQGRYHYYEGYKINEVVFPVRVLCGLGIEKLLLTNAAGGINPGYAAGDLMIIRDHINLMGVNPLRGENEECLGPRFPNMSEVYDPLIRTSISRGMEHPDIHLIVKEGVYAALGGPSYETPAEIKMLSILGADAVGMSTVPEAIAARHMGVKVGGISCITNMAAGVTQKKPDHEDVMATAALVRQKFIDLLGIVIHSL